MQALKVFSTFSLVYCFQIAETDCTYMRPLQTLNLLHYTFCCTSLRILWLVM